MTDLAFTRPSNAAASLTLGRVLAFDAATCLAIGAALLALAEPLAEPFGLPAVLLRGAGALLLPCALLMVWAARRGPRQRALAGLVVAGNAAWALASAAVCVLNAPSALGEVVVLVQAAAVVVLAALEWRGLRRLA